VNPTGGTCINMKTKLVVDLLMCESAAHPASLQPLAAIHV